MADHIAILTDAEVIQAEASTRSRILTLLSDASYADWLACALVGAGFVMLVLAAGVLS